MDDNTVCGSVVLFNWQRPDTCMQILKVFWWTFSKPICRPSLRISNQTSSAEIDGAAALQPIEEDNALSENGGYIATGPPPASAMAMIFPKPKAVGQESCNELWHCSKGAGT